MPAGFLVCGSYEYLVAGSLVAVSHVVRVSNVSNVILVLCHVVAEFPSFFVYYLDGVETCWEGLELFGGGLEGCEASLHSS